MANTFDPFIPEWWAMGALAILNEKLVAVPLVNKDFSEEFAKGGQIVNTRRPRKMTATRKHKTTAIASQDVGADNVPIPLNQHIYNSFTVHDLDQQFSMTDLIQTYLAPAGFALARMADRVVLGQMAQFLYAGNVAGNSANRVYENIVDTRTLMDNNLAYEDGRHLILNPNVEGKLLKDVNLITQYAAGTTQALRAGIVGNLVGVDLYKTQNLFQLALNTGATGVTSLIVLAAKSAGALTFVSTAQSGVATVAGDWVIFAGQPYEVASVAGSGPYTFTLTKALRNDLATSQVGYVFKTMTLNADYASAWGEGIVLSPQSNEYAPQIGQMIKLGSFVYTVIDTPASNTILLDRPLDSAITAAGTRVASIPNGSYSMAFHRDAITVAIRPLAPTKAGAGALSAVASANGLTVRAQMWYNGSSQNMQVSLDFLMGIQTLDTNLGAVMVC